MSNEDTYPGIDQDLCGGMTPTGTIIKDAWLFDILPQSETCRGWNKMRLLDLYEKVYAAWEPYGHMVSRLTPELREKHTAIHEAAIKRARELGWNPELGDDD